MEILWFLVIELFAWLFSDIIANWIVYG